VRGRAGLKFVLWVGLELELGPRPGAALVAIIPRPVDSVEEEGGGGWFSLPIWR